MGMHNRSTRSTTARVASRLALMGGTAAVAGAMTLAGAGTASAAGFHIFGHHHSQKHAEHKLGITGSPGSESQATQSTQAKSSTAHRAGHDATHQTAKANVSAEHHVGKTGSTTH